MKQLSDVERLADQWISETCELCRQVQCTRGGCCIVMWNVADTAVVDLAPLYRAVLAARKARAKKGKKS